MAEFSLYQKKQRFEQGWVVIPQVIPAEMVRAARCAINSTIENYLDSIQVRAHELKIDERLTNLLLKTDAFLFECIMPIGLKILSMSLPTFGNAGTGCRMSLAKHEFKPNSPLIQNEVPPIAIVVTAPS